MLAKLSALFALIKPLKSKWDTNKRFNSKRVGTRLTILENISPSPWILDIK